MQEAELLIARQAERTNNGESLGAKRPAIKTDLGLSGFKTVYTAKHFNKHLIE